MARRKTRKKQSSRSRKAPMPGWVWLMCGLGIGLSVAAGIYVKDRQPQISGPAPPTAPPAAAQPTVKTQEPETDSPERFDFYNILPKFEVVIPEEDIEVKPDVTPRPVNSPGLYVLQAGSFSTYSDADRTKANLAMLGIVSRIQKVTVDDNVYHRVRIGPVDSLEELNTMRQKLRQAKIEVLVIRVGE